MTEPLQNFCEHCGFELVSQEASYCGGCGRRIISNQPVKAESLTATQASSKEKTWSSQSTSSRDPEAPRALIDLPELLRRRFQRAEPYRLTAICSVLSMILVIQACTALHLALRASDRIAAIDGVNKAFPVGYVVRSSIALREADDAVATAGVIWGYSGLATLLLLIAWTWRISTNAHLWGAPRHSHKWAILGWLLPVANLVIPYRVISDGWQVTSRTRWKHSNDSAASQSDKKANRALPSLFLGWTIFWAGYLLTRIGNGIADVQAVSFQDPRDFYSRLQLGDFLLLGGSTSIALSCLLTARAVTLITRRHNAVRSTLRDTPTSI